MKKFLTIGLGNFGFNISRSLVENGCEVLGIDTSENIVENAKDYISHAIIADATNKDALESLSLQDYDAAIVSIGQEMAPSILIALYLIENKIPKIIVRAISEDHGKILKMIGVTDVIFPEQDMAIRLANKLSQKNAVDYLPIGQDYSIVEVIPPDSFSGKSLKDLQIASRFNCQVIGIKTVMGGRDSINEINNNASIKIAPTANDVITEKSILIIIGKDSDIQKFQSIK
ncbi:MAG: TrkA family potassium uptake protein [Spirochaetes bacterium]|nr:TrkA family potassium uptake protein [Spirochaetota bacterium]